MQPPGPQQPPPLYAPSNGDFTFVSSADAEGKSRRGRWGSGRALPIEGQGGRAQQADLFGCLPVRCVGVETGVGLVDAPPLTLWRGPVCVAETSGVGLGGLGWLGGLFQEHTGRESIVRDLHLVSKQFRTQASVLCGMGQATH